jgi:GNAT superfamily N-acetyltransferase|tara:strand:+ start:90 stop:584 length:495 start_codon:yes stop_codon:yes gene_type:complete
MDNLIIRNATKSDVPAILDLIQELATFEREPNAVAVTEAELIQDGFGETPVFECFVATIESKVVGMALYYPCYSTWKGKSWHLEDLIVMEPHRGKGIGFALLKKFISFAYKTGVRRIQWVVLDWNTPAINFYEKQGATTLSDWNITQMTEVAMQKFIAEQDARI